MMNKPLSARGETPEIEQSPKERLLWAAITVFSNQGYHGATTREIARVAKMNIASIPYYYGSKEGLYDACLESIFKLVTSKFRGVLLTIGELLDSPKCTRKAVREQLHMFIRNLCLTFTGDTINQEILKIFISEQNNPTASFPRIYSNIQPLLETFARAIAYIANLPYPSRKATLLTLSIIGQVIVFRTHREIVLRRLENKNGLTCDDSEEIGAMICLHTDTILDMYARRKNA